MKTKLYKQLLVAALSLLMVAPALADDSQNSVTVRLSQNPSMVSAQLQAKPLNGQAAMMDDTTYIFKLYPGQALDVILSAYEDDGWKFQNWMDDNGNILSTQPRADLQISAAGEYHYTANYRFSPRNPGFLPMGSYDLETGTLTVYNPQNGEIMSNFYALCDRYNLSTYGEKDHHHDMPMPEDLGNFNPFNTLIAQGYLNTDDSWYIDNMTHGAGVQMLDLTQLVFSNNAVGSGVSYINSAITTIKLGADVQSIAPSAFWGMTGLQEVYCFAETVPEIDTTSFTFSAESYEYSEEEGWHPVTISNPNIITLYVPASALVAYQNDAVWPTLFNIQPMAISTTANLSIIPDIILEGMSLRLTQVAFEEEMVLPLTPAQTRYSVMNLEKGQSYHVAMYSPLGFLMDEKTFVLGADTTVSLTNAAPLGEIPARVFVDGVEITDQVLISWFNTAGTEVLGTGDRSPLLPMQYNTPVNVLPLAELASYVEPKDTFAVNALGHNGLMINLERKPVGIQDTVRIETGTVVASIQGDASNMVGLLYDSEGNLLGKSSFEQVLLGSFIAVPGIPVGHYTIVTMREGQYSTLSRLDLYQSMGLTEGTDYIVNAFDILADQITYVTIETIPEEPQIDNFLSTDAHFYASKSEVMVAGQIILTAEVGFLEEYVADITNVFYVIDLPENVQLVENSVMVGNNTAGYAFQNGQLRVGVGMANLANKNATALRFCVVPAAVGEFYPSASVEFNYHNQAKMQPISNTYFAAQAITVQAPSYVIEKGMTVTGFAPAYANVNIVTAENETIGNGTANALGKYNIRCAFTASGSRTLVLHAEASTPIISGILSDTCSTFYDGEFAAPTEIQMTHYNKWYKKNMTIIWNLDSCATNQKYYYYYLDADFTFRAHFIGNPDTVTFVAIGQDGSRTNIPASYGGNGQWYATQRIQTYKVPVRVDLVYGVGSSSVSYETCKAVGAIADPSGYVYEAVSSNRLPGVTATAYMKKSEEDLPILWDAEDYDQKNPLITDEAGGYAWDVPAAWWQVRFTKAGYEPAQTKWLPVPPPQMEVNIPLVRTSAPLVQSVKAYADNILINFDRYMMEEDLNSTMIRVSDGTNPIAGTFELLDHEPRFKGDSIYYTSKVKFVPNAAFSTATVEVQFDGCRSYAGIPMDFATQPANVVAEVKNFANTDTVFLTVGQDAQRAVRALPAFAAAGKTMVFDELQTDLYTVTSHTGVIDGNGDAVVTFHGKMPGTTEMRVSVEGTELETYMIIVVKAAPVPHEGSSIEVVPQTEGGEMQPAALKVFENGTIYLQRDDHRYTTTGMMVR